MNSLGRGGAETQLFHLATALAEVGRGVSILAVSKVGVDIQPLEDVGVRVIALGASGRKEKMRKLPTIARFARGADAVHCTGWDATLWGRLAAVMARRPVVITEHSDPNRTLQVIGRGVSRAQMIAVHNRLLDRVTYATIVVGACQIEQLESEGVRGESIVHIPNAVPVEALRGASLGGPTRSDLGIADDARVVIQVARFVPQKGQMSTLRAIADLRRRGGDDLRLVFVGEGPGEAEVRAEAARLGAEWAVFLGKRDDVPGLLRLADLCVLPSSGEGLPMSLIEALAIGIPMVATDVGDIRWLIESTGAGICVASGEQDQFTEACARILDDRDLRQRLAAAATAAAQDFDAKKMARRYVQVLDAAVSSAPLPLVLNE